MPASVTVASPSIKNKTYTVSGDTLGAIYNDLIAKQPGGTDAVGDCSTKVIVPAVKKFDEEKNEKFKGKGQEEWVVTAKSGLEVTIDATITLPVLKSDDKLKKAAKKEWARWLKALTAHEDLHVEAAKTVAEECAKELSNLKGTGQGKDKDAAIAAAEKDFVKKYDAAFGGTKVSARVDKAHKALDAKGNTFTMDLDAGADDKE
jgi:predicted secreted Zn-dependent protease